jgi:hypothetical protein
VISMKAVATWARQDLLRVEVVLKSAAAAAVAGGINAVCDLYKSGKHFQLNTAHLLELKSAFVSGAFIGTLMFLVKSPLFRAKQQQTDANSAS